AVRHVGNVRLPRAGNLTRRRLPGTSPAAPPRPTATRPAGSGGEPGDTMDGAEDHAMPLRDHFRPPLDDQTSWEGFHGQWPAMIVQALARKLPPRYVAAPRVHSGAFVEVDVATYEKDVPDPPFPDADNGNGGGVATAVWAPPRPT